MFDIWLRAQMQGSFLWKVLENLSKKELIHRRWFIESWGQCCLALTRRLIYMLYGGNNGANSVFIFWPVLGTNVISVSYMLEGRGSMLAPTSQQSLGQLNNQLPKPKNTARQKGKGLPTKINDNNNNNSKNNDIEFAYLDGTSQTFEMGGDNIIKKGRKHARNMGGRTLSMATYLQIDEPRLIIYLWNSMLNVLDMNSINDPKCFGCSIAWVSRMVDMFLNIQVTSIQRESGIIPPNGNSILKIFSNKLFTAAVNMNGFEEARAIALGALSRIFTSKPNTIFHNKYLLNYYHTLHELLKDAAQIEETAREQVILNGELLFSCDFNGSRALITTFLPHIGIILRKPHKPRKRLSAITMLCTFISLEWHFWPDNASHKINHSQIPKLRKHLKLIPTILFDAIQTETNEYNLQKLLWCTIVYLTISCRYISNSRPFASNLVRTIWKHIYEEATHWPVHVIKTAFNGIKYLINFIKVLKKNNDSVVNYKMFIEMTKYATSHLSHGNQFEVNQRRILSISAMKTLVKWCIIDPTLVRNKNCCLAIKDLITKATLILNKKKINGRHGTSIWDNAMSSNGNPLNPNKIIVNIHEIAGKLARKFFLESGSTHNLTYLNEHRFAATFVDENDIELYIKKQYNNVKWNKNDRIRYFFI